MRLRETLKHMRAFGSPLGSCEEKIVAHDTGKMRTFYGGDGGENPFVKANEKSVHRWFSWRVESFNFDPRKYSTDKKRKISVSGSDFLGHFFECTRASSLQCAV